ncbi:hypothetical protein SLEP1_g29344 [Rubroshorea leprosula]|uniref:Uncharacterized protein n=1 Tax=Rubroshorea leprosula TaxID=152421 RepID=A0AAV5K871_9ROSI|nr:hypothetical protein SLEP1_g29344 [Rubroshorea leprosula]
MLEDSALIFLLGIQTSSAFSGRRLCCNLRVYNLTAAAPIRLLLRHLRVGN